MSADIDLSMLELGAAGSTEQEIATALHSGRLSADENAAAWRVLVSSELAAQSPGELSLANSLWVQQHLQVETGFLRTDAVDFGNDTYQVNFESPSATKAINAWVAKQTDRRITMLFSAGELSKTTVVVLANALHVHAAWAKAHEFTVRDEPFVTGSGTTVSVPTLNAARDHLAFATTPSYQAVQIPFTTGRVAALVVAPKHGTISSWLAGLTPHRLAAVVGTLSAGAVDLTMPTLDLSSRPLLNTALTTMGMAEVFNSADLAPMLGRSVGTNVVVSKVQQAETLKVTTGGIDAAASTGSSATFTSVYNGAVIDFDRPYLFLVRDTKSGTILFSSVVNDPARP
jgi:serpin B